MGSNPGLAIFFLSFSPKWDKKWILACQSFGECTARVKLELTDFNLMTKMQIQEYFEPISHIKWDGAIKLSALFFIQMWHGSNFIRTLSKKVHPALYAIPNIQQLECLEF